MKKDRSMEWVEYTKVDAEITMAKERIVSEVSLSIYVNGEQYATAMITPMMEKEFVIGHLFARGIIDSVDKIESIAVNDGIAEVTVSGIKEKAEQSPGIQFDFQVNKEGIFQGINTVLNSEIYAETGAIHSAGIFQEGAVPVCVTEDIGRHNALDKVIGYALNKGIDFRNTFAVSTGRMVSEMVLKVCRANIPIVATKAAVTKLGVEIGEERGLTIIGYVRDRGMKISTDTDEKIATERLMKIYTHPQRVLL
ncbi:formate dehydrogenase accessory sulfurtransferase FdhD [Chloroflexota bacterium]